MCGRGGGGGCAGTTRPLGEQHPRQVSKIPEELSWRRCENKIDSDISFVCHYWQWPILIKCVKCYCLCVLRWLMRPILAINCLLQIEQEKCEEGSSVGDTLALAFRWEHVQARLRCFFFFFFFFFFCFVFTSTPSYEASPLCSILCNLFPRLCWYVESIKDALMVSLQCFFWPPWERFPLVVLHRGFSLAKVNQAFL